MSQHSLNKVEIISLIVRLSVVSAVTFFSVRWLINQLDPTSKNKRSAKKRAQEQIKRLTQNNHLNLSIDNLTEYEMMIAQHLVHPEDIQVEWNNIAGLKDLINELKETVILPIKRKELFADSQLTTAPKGVLLHGPPGCGKTLIAKATAKEAGTRFINLDLSILTDKWYGESQKLASAVFSLAVKLQPCIIFIDEIDSFLRSRNYTDHEATAMMKAQFMSLWDGLITDNDCTVIVMGATNRPEDLDKAILRRMPATFYVPFPKSEQREEILNLILNNEPVDDNIDIKKISLLTDNFSGSDLRELCRKASLYRVSDFNKQLSSQMINEDEYHDALRPITMEDFLLALKKMKESKKYCGSGSLLQLQTGIDLD